MEDLETPTDYEWTGKTCKKCKEGAILIAIYPSEKRKRYCQNCWLEDY